jgi:hypothetical protein
VPEINQPGSPSLTLKPLHCGAPAVHCVSFWCKKVPAILFCHQYYRQMHAKSRFSQNQPVTGDSKWVELVLPERPAFSKNLTCRPFESDFKQLENR